MLLHCVFFSFYELLLEWLWGQWNATQPIHVHVTIIYYYIIMYMVRSHDHIPHPTQVPAIHRFMKVQWHVSLSLNMHVGSGNVHWSVILGCNNPNSHLISLFSKLCQQNLGKSLKSNIYIWTHEHPKTYIWLHY